MAQICFQTTFVCTVSLAAANLKVVPAKEKYLLWGDDSFRAAGKISDSTLKEILVIPCQDDNINVYKCKPMS